MAMQRVKFTALPDESGPVSPGRLDELQDKVEEYIDTKSSINRTSGYITTPKWYRIANLGTFSSLGASFILNIWTRYSSTNNSSFMLAINVTHNNAKITQINGLENIKNVIDKIRVVKDTSDNYVYIEIYAGTATGSNLFTAEILSNSDIRMLGLIDTTETVTVFDELDLQGSITTGTEFKTGLVIDGKEEYGKKINIGALPDTTTKTVVTGLTNITRTRPIMGVAIAESGNSRDIPYNEGTDVSIIYVKINASGNTLTVGTKSDLTAYSGHVTLYYTKN